MHYFTYKKNVLHCEGLDLRELGARFGTPLYVYSAKTILRHFAKIKQAFRPLAPLICYSVKANSNLSVLKLLLRQGAGLDIVSGGELYRAKAVNCPPGRIVYASVGKTNREIKQAINYGILMFNVESSPELAKINQIAGRLGKKVKVCLRVNPDVEAQTHSYVTTGKKENKFGLNLACARQLFLNQKPYPHLKLVGIHIHIGSQITQSAPFVKAIKRINKLVQELEARGVRLKYLNIGGGLGIVYNNEKPQTAQAFAKKVVPLLRANSLRLILEPGRFIVGNAGILLTRVTYLKDSGRKRFLVVDAAMNDLIRPSLYEAYHTILPVVRGPKTSRLSDVVGPVCESGDFLGKGRRLAVGAGDYVAVMGAGAYGFSMSSNYNSRPRAAEVLVDKNKARLIRKRETYRDLIAKELV